MLYYLHSVEREPSDPQEERALLGLQLRSISWLEVAADDPRIRFAFRGERNASTHLFLDATSHLDLHELVDADPLASYSTVALEPVLTPVEMAQALERYLGHQVLAPTDWKELSALSSGRALDPTETLFLARKLVRPFSPLLSQHDQDIIHHNTLISQKAHMDPREVADFNPVGKPVGILIMRAGSVEEVLAHVSDCEVFVDSQVTIERLLTLPQARQNAEEKLERLSVGGFRLV